MMSSMMMRMLNPMMDDAMVKMMTKDYPENPLVMFTILDKLNPIALMECGIRAELGKELQRPIGSPVVLSPWENILLNPKQLFQLPTADITQIDSKTTIGKNARKPLVLDIPIMITGMSYGGSLSIQMKTALAKGASLAGTSTNTGESAVVDQERDSAKYLIGQYHRGGWLNKEEQLKRVDAIEIQFGQGAFGGGVQSTIKHDQMRKNLKVAWDIDENEDATIYSRFQNANSTNEIVSLVNDLKGKYEVPVGIKIAGSDYIEYELEVIAKTNVDYIVVDGSEGGTAAAPPTLEDNVGLPTLYSLVRAADWLSEHNLKDKYSLIAAGGLTTPGHFLKALALGADAVYIGSIALMAAMQTQMTIALPQSPPPQIALYSGKLKEELDVDLAAQHLANFLSSCIAEMKLAIQAIGKSSVHDLCKDDLVTVDRNLAEFINIRYAASHRNTKNEVGNKASANNSNVANGLQKPDNSTVQTSTNMAH